MRPDGVRTRVGAVLALSAALLALAPLVPAAASPPSGASGQEATAVVARALQVADDAGYLPVQSHGRWTLASPGSWLQYSMSTTSSPWRWTVAGRCTVLDPSLVAGMTAFMHAQIAGTFAGAEAAHVRSGFDARVRRVDPSSCVRSATSMVLGPPGPLRDRASVRYVVVSGATATAAAVVHQTDWQGSVTHAPTPGGGRRVNWAVVSNVVDVTYNLAQVHGGWRVVAFTGRFAPGGGP